MDEKGPHCSLTQVMLERYLSDAVKAHIEDEKYNEHPAACILETKDAYGYEDDSLHKEKDELPKIS